jgi:hypothetical protein
LTGWQRAAAGAPAFGGGQSAPADQTGRAASPTESKEQELGILKQQVEEMEQQMNSLRERIQQLESAD